MIFIVVAKAVMFDLGELNQPSRTFEASFRTPSLPENSCKQSFDVVAKQFGASCAWSLFR